MNLRMVRMTMNLRMVRMMLVSLAIFAMASAAYGQVGLFITVAPPPLPVYEQPLCPDDGYLWTPGYWAFDSDIEDYYWVPGTWVQPPEVGYLWTPAYWGWGGDRFVFYDGYWGPLVGFYGGIDYGFGYFGNGFEGGRWDNGRFFYNQSVSNVNVTVIHNVYNNRVEERSENRVSYNGGQGGLNARPTPQQEAAARDRHVPPVAAQMQHRQEARSNPQQRASVNRGKPEVAATVRPGAYREGAVQARSAGGNYTPPANRGNAQSRDNMGGRATENSTRMENNARPASGSGGSSYGHVREMPPYDRPSSTGSDKNYQKEQDKMYKQQQKERDNVAKQQQKEDQRMAKQHDEQAKQQVEQRHQQQTQEMQSRHQQQQQQMQQRSAPRSQPEPRSAPSHEQPEGGRRPPQ